MIFVTVGTVFPFDRLIRAVDEAAGEGVLGDDFFAQIGRGGYRPRHMKWAEDLDKEAYSRHVSTASALIGHAGTGTIVCAAEAGKPLLIMPRRASLGEHVNDHQVATARKYGEMGCVLVADTEADIPARIRELGTFVPKPRQISPEPIVARINAFLSELELRERKR